MPTEYHILKKGQLEGPYVEEEVIRRVKEGALDSNDLGQTPQSYYWMPLHRLLGEQIGAAPVQPEPARFRVFLEDIGERMWIVFLQFPWESGLLCLGVGLVVAVFTFIPVLMYGPWLLAALTAGGMLFLRGRTAQGVGLCAAAVLLPIIIVLLLMR